MCSNSQVGFDVLSGHVAGHTALHIAGALSTVAMSLIFVCNATNYMNLPFSMMTSKINLTRLNHYSVFCCAGVIKTINC